MKKKIFIVVAIIGFLAVGTDVVFGNYISDSHIDKNKGTSTPVANIMPSAKEQKENKIEGNASSGDEKTIENPKEKIAEVRDYTPLINDIKQYCSSKKGTYGVYFKSLTNGQEFGINDNEEYVAASTVKLPVNLCLFQQVISGKVNLEDKMEYLEEDYEEGCGDIQYGKVGLAYKLRELSKYSIEESDNVAVNMLIRYLGRESICSFREKIVSHSVPRDKNVSNPKDMALYLQYLLDFNKTHPNEGQELLTYLENTEFNDRIPVYLPKDVQVAHKIGNQVGAVHDVGIVFAKKPFIITIMSKEVNEDQANETIARIAEMVYNFEQK